MKFQAYENKNIGKYNAIPSKFASGDLLEAVYTSRYPKRVVKDSFDFNTDAHAVNKINSWKTAIATKRTQTGGMRPKLNVGPRRQAGGGGGSDADVKSFFEDVQAALKLNINIMKGSGSNGECNVCGPRPPGKKSQPTVTVTKSKTQSGGVGWKGVVLKEKN